MTVRMRTIEHVFGTIKHWMGLTHFLTRRLPNVATEMSLHVLAYNLKARDEHPRHCQNDEGDEAGGRMSALSCSNDVKKTCWNY